MRKSEEYGITNENKFPVMQRHRILQSNWKRIQNNCLESIIELQENSEKQFSELKNNVNEQRLNLFIKSQREIMELKDSMKQMKNALESLGNRVDETEERITNLEDRNLEMMQLEEERTKI